MWFWDITGWILGIVGIILLSNWMFKSLGKGMAICLGAPLILFGVGCSYAWDWAKMVVKR